MLQGTYPSPTTLVAYGPEDTCKHETIKYVLRIQQIDFVPVDCRECLSQRHLLTKIFSQCVQFLRKEDDLDRYDRLDNINALASNLRKLFEKRKEKLVILITGADQQRGSTATLFPALARLGDLVRLLPLLPSRMLRLTALDPMFVPCSHIDISTATLPTQKWCTVRSVSTVQAQRSNSDRSSRPPSFTPNAFT